MVRPTLTLLAVVGIAACDGVPPLPQASASAELVAGAVLDALAARDEARLRRLALDEPEFRHRIWPSLPAAQPERNLPFSYVWGDLKQKSDTSLRRTLARHGGRRYTLERVSFSGATDYPRFRVHRGAMFRVRDASGAPRDVRICGSIVEQAGRWKVFSYVVDD
jgi:hypothetical protein